MPKPKYRVYKVTVSVKYGTDSSWMHHDEPLYFMSLTAARKYLKYYSQLAYKTMSDSKCAAPKGSVAKGEYRWTRPAKRPSAVRHYKVELFELTGNSAKRFFIKQVKGGFSEGGGFYFFKDSKKVPKDIQEKYGK